MIASDAKLGGGAVVLPPPQPFVASHPAMTKNSSIEGSHLPSQEAWWRGEGIKMKYGGRVTGWDMYFYLNNTANRLSGFAHWAVENGRARVVYRFWESQNAVHETAPPPRGSSTKVRVTPFVGKTKPRNRAMP